MLDCADGYQKENPKEAEEVEENYRQEANSNEATGKEGSQEIGEEEDCSEKSDEKASGRPYTD